MEKTNKLFLSWPETFGAGRGIAGGKGWNLARLVQYGFPVPRGGVLSTEAFHQFSAANGLAGRLARVSQEVTIDRLAEQEPLLEALRREIIVTPLPSALTEELRADLRRLGLLDKPLAVRSSAGSEDSASASFAGIHDSFLNVRGLENILRAVRSCYASLWSPRAVAYRRKMNILDQDVAPAIVIMEMVDAVAAGIAFTCDPRTGREDIMVINANFGLGESIVSGAVEPDEYRASTSSGLMLDRKIGRKQARTIAAGTHGTELVRTQADSGSVLSDEQIYRLCLLCLRVMDTLGQGEEHQDIEWVFDGKDYFLVQTRPATALPRYTYPDLKSRPDFWSNANSRDVLPMVVTTLSWSIYRYDLNVMLSIAVRTSGYPLLEGLRRVRLFNGRLYMNLSLMQWEYFDGAGMLPREINQIMGGHQPEITVQEAGRYRGRKGLKRILAVIRLTRASLKAKKEAASSFERLRQAAKRFRQKDCSALTDQELLAHLGVVQAEIQSSYPVYMMLTGLASQPVDMLIKILDRSFPNRAHSLINALMTGKDGITSAEQGYKLLSLAEIARNDPAARSFLLKEPFDPSAWKGLPDSSAFKRGFSAFLDEYGHRAVYESELMNPRWREDPSYLLNNIRSSLDTADLGAVRERQRLAAERAQQEVRAKLGLFKRLQMGYLINQAVRGAQLREMARSVLNLNIEPLLTTVNEIGRRLAERKIIPAQDDIFHCTFHEIRSILGGCWDGSGLALAIRERKTLREENEKLHPPDIIIGDVPQQASHVTAAAGQVLTGLGVAAGKAEGPVRIVHHPAEGDRLRHRDVLVAPSTDPGWTPLFLRASAIAMETGGYLSHGAIVAREYGIPAVVNIPGLLTAVKDGEKIIVDGDEGRLVRIED